MENLCFTDRSLQFSKIAHKSLEEFYSSFSSVSSPWRPFFFFPHQRHLSLPHPYPLPLSLSSAGPGKQQGEPKATAGAGAARPERRAALEQCASRRGGRLRLGSARVRAARRRRACASGWWRWCMGERAAAARRGLGG
jgi:hypothetical protein